MLPDIYFFNPTCEPAIANGSPYYTAPARLRKFEEDLCYLPIWLAEENDYILIQGSLVPEYHKKLKDLGFEVPSIIKIEEALLDEAWLNEPKGRLKAWGYSPAVHQLFKPILPSFSDEFRNSAISTWQFRHKNLFSRLTGIEILKNMIAELPVPWLVDLTNVPDICSTLEEIYLKVALHSKAVVKTPWSSSGRGLLLFPNPDLKKKNDEVLSGMLKQQGFVTVEPWLNKLTDISFQFLILNGQPKYMGRTFFETDPKGRYLRNYLTDGTELSVETADFLAETHSQVIEMLLLNLAKSDYGRYYEGWVGVDALIFKSDDGQLKLHPVVEVNGRFTMGAIALKLRDYLAPNSKGYLSIYYSKSTNFQMFSGKREKDNPLVMKDGKIISGFMPLTPPLTEHAFGAFLEVER